MHIGGAAGLGGIFPCGVPHFIVETVSVGTVHLIPGHFNAVIAPGLSLADRTLAQRCLRRHVSHILTVYRLSPGLAGRFYRIVISNPCLCSFVHIGQL